MSLNTAFYSRYDKIDCGQRFSEFKRVFDQLNERGNDIVVLFAHSFSFLNWRRTPNNPKFNYNLRNRLEQQLRYIRNNVDDISILTIDEALAIFNSMKYGETISDTIVCMRGVGPFIWFIDRALGVIKSRVDIHFRKL